MSNRSEEPILSGPGDLFRFSLSRCFLTNSGVILSSVSFSSESPLNLTFELEIFSVFSHINDDAKKAFNSSAINFESELLHSAPSGDQYCL